MFRGTILGMGINGCQLKKTLLVVSAALIFGCSIIKTEHIKPPGIENERSINRWLKSTQLLDNDYIVLTLAPEFYFNFEFSSKIKFTPLFYPFKSRSILVYNGCTTKICMNQLRSFTEGINPSTMYNPDVIKDSILTIEKGLSFEKVVYESFANYFCTTKGEKYTLHQDSLLDYYLILPFTTFFGTKTQIRDMKSFLTATYSNTKSKFKVILLNMDKQEWWGKEWNEKIELSFKVVK